jgi:HD superfamily phosphodiesterase
LSRFSAFKSYFTGFLKAELSPDLHYHGFHHTLDVYAYAVEIAKAEGISRDDLTLLKVAVLLHDAGFTQTYSGHEDVSERIAKSLLPGFDFNADEIDRICSMIEATKIPQKPVSLLDKIIADADLMYLGTDRFKEIGDTLFEEMKVYSGLQTRKQWDAIQIKFLNMHHFHTDYCRSHFEHQKQKNLQQLIQETKLSLS